MLDAVLSQAPIWVLVMAQVVIQLPACCVIVYVASTADDLISVIDGSHSLGTTSTILAVTAGVICIAVFAIAGYYTKHELDRMVAEEEEETAMDSTDGTTLSATIPAAEGGSV